MESGTDAAPLILPSEPLSPSTQRMEPWTDGVPLTLRSELLYHPELREWSLGVIRAPLM